MRKELSLTYIYIWKEMLVMKAVSVLLITLAILSLPLGGEGEPNAMNNVRGIKSMPLVSLFGCPIAWLPE